MATTDKYYTILTNIGKAKIANAAGLGTKINFVTMKVGDGGGTLYDPTESQLDLVHTVWQGAITHVEIDEENTNWINIEVLIPPADGGFFIREYGVFDSDGNMLAIAKCAETYKPLPADGATKEITMKMVLAISNTSSITLKIDPTVIFAKKSEVEVVQNQVNTIATEIQNARGTYENLKARLDHGDTQLSDMGKNQIYYCGATSGTNAYTVTNSKITAYIDGLTVRIKIGTASTGSSTLNINALGAKPILDTLGNAITSGGLKAGLPYQLCYNGTNFIVLGKGGGGNLTSADLLINKTGTGDSGPVSGSMPENGALNASLNCGQSFSVPAGHTSGGSIVANSLASQTPSNADASKIVSGYHAWINGSDVWGNASIASLGGKQYASGTVTSGATTQTFYAQNNSTTYVMPYVTVTGLSFKPTFIYLMTYAGGAGSIPTTIYSEVPESCAKPISVTIHSSNTNSSTGYSFNGETLPASVTSNGFVLPVSVKSVSYTWIAIG